MMKRFNLYTSNRLEILAEKLAEVLSTPLSSPLTPEIIVVQSKGMERWVSMQLAQRLGVCANIRFPFPNVFVHQMFRTVLPDIPENSPFDKDVMTWKLMDILNSEFRNQYSELKSYIGEPANALNCFQLAERIADTFDQYLMFRPEMMLKWQRDPAPLEKDWQIMLWKELIKRSNGVHRAEMEQMFLKEIGRRQRTAGRGQQTAGTIPERICVFGISSLPSFHIRVLDAIAQLSQIHLFLMNPCQEFWGDILSKKEIKRIARIQLSLFSENTADDSALHPRSSSELHLEQGNSLLASMGTMGRDFFNLIQEVVSNEIPMFHDPLEDGHTLLHWIQSDILNLTDRSGQPKEVIADNDRSIQIHSCHSPMREIEVLHDRLLEMFETDSELLPGDILVMTPDIEAYEPYIESVFDAPGDNSHKIPFSIADRSAKTESRIIEVFLQILNLHQSRFTTTQVMSVIETPAVYEKFHLRDADLERIRRWLQETRIRWGIDEKNRSALGLPDFSENTWKAGLDRLLLGYALPGKETHMFGGILPYDYIEGGDAEILGNFIEFIEHLTKFVRSLNHSRNLTEWAETLKYLLDAFFKADDASETEMKLIRQAIHEFIDFQQRSGFDEALDVRVIISHLTHRFKTTAFGFGFMTGKITFGAMLPMRSIPFKVIALIGMNGDAFPRASTQVSFDRIAKNPRPGDRSRRNDDRYLFLESLLSARQKLYISYIGQNIRDNSIIPPSVLVSELEDYIEAGFEIAGKHIITEHLVTRHRLQAFSPEYFRKQRTENGRQENAAGLFSYSRENLETARCLVKPRKVPQQFISKGLPEPEPIWKTITLHDLCSFYVNPAKFLLTRRLGIWLDDTNDSLEEKETFRIAGLEKHSIEQYLLERQLDGLHPDELLKLTKATGCLPHGTVGQCVWETMQSEVSAFIHTAGPYLRTRHLEPVDIDVELSGFRVIGKIEPICPDYLLHFRYAAIKPKDYLRLWICHLMLNYLKPDGYPQSGLLIGLKKNNRTKTRQIVAVKYTQTTDCRSVMETLLKYYWQGLKTPLPFFPESSLAYAKVMMRIPNRNEAIQKARDEWSEKWNSDYSESQDVYIRQCWGTTDPLNAEFEKLAMKIWDPLLMNLSETEL